MAISKVILNGITQIDLTQDTVNAASSLSGVTGHGANGEEFTGSYVAPHGTKTITENGTGINVTEYAFVDVNIPETVPSLQTKNKTYTPTESQQTETILADNNYDGLNQVNITINAISSSYIGSDITQRSSTDLTASGATVTVPSGYYASQATKSITSGSATTPATTVSVTPSISIDSSGLITATASGTKSVTPTVSAGYISTGTAGTITVSGSNTSQLSTQAATTITPSSSQQTAVAAGKYTTGAVIVNPIPSSYVQPTSTKGATTYNTSTTDQTIASGTYLTGAQTIKAVKVTGLAASNVASGVTVKVGDANDDDRIASVTGTLSFVTYYTGTSAPANSLGSNGDIYLQTAN